jgi:hypothetical protein
MMKETIRKVTKAEAFDKFLTERVIGDAPFAFNTATRSCCYSNKVGGGCAIGCLLPAEVAEDLPQNQSISSPEIQAAAALYLEDHDSNFWDQLQRAHDELAAYVSALGSRGEQISHQYSYQMALRAAAELV